MHGLSVVTIDIRNYVPTVSGESLRRVVRKPTLDMAVDGYPVVIVEHDELAQSKRAGQRTGFVRNARHQATVAEKHVRIVREQLQPRAVELLRQQFLRYGHPDSVGDALTEWSSRGFCPR